MPGLNIAFFGSSLVSAYWNGAATYYRGIVRALHDRGHRVTFYESDAYDRQKHRDMPNPSWANVVVYSHQGTEEVSHCLDDAAHADVIIKASGNGVFDELLESAVLQLKNGRNLVCFWDVDAPATLDRVQNNPLDLFHGCIPEYDLILTYGGGDPVIQAYESLGARQCVPIYNAVDPATHQPVRQEAHFRADLAFLGNRLPDREARVEEFFFKPAALLPDKRFLIGGSGWHDKPMTANVVNAGHVYTKDHNAFNCTPCSVLNVNRESMARYGFSPATRIFEAAGAAACMITDAFVGVELFFEPGKEILVAECGEEVAAYVAGLTPSQSWEIGEAALRRVLSCHTYRHRVEQLEEVLGVPRMREAATV
jgi:spore maturation protein CgeB